MQTRKRTTLCPSGENLRSRFILVWLSGLLYLSTAPAIDIRYELGDTGQKPSYDPDGTRLLAIMEAAAVLWEDVVPVGAFTMWTSSGAKAISGRNPSRLTSGRRKLGTIISFSMRGAWAMAQSAGSWFIAPTPFDHSEFDFHTRSSATPGQVAIESGGTSCCCLSQTSRTGIKLCTPKKYASRRYCLP